jgi:ABC-type spermidine/putrescine transport system permease subunit II
VDGAGVPVSVPAAVLHDGVLFNSTRQDANFTGFSLRWYEALTKDTKIVEGFWLS